MNIQFHYFVIRFLTKRMGFDDKSSQIIASAAQFIDDSNDASEAAAVSFKKAEIQGKKVELRGLYSNDGAKVKVYIPRTIHKAFDDYGKPEDFDYTDLNHICWQSMVPFHYPPLTPIDYSQDECLNYQVEAPDEYYTGNIFKELTDYAINQYSKRTPPLDTYEETLIRIGTITHMLAACFSHINVNGLISPAMNNTVVRQVMNGDFESYLTDNYILSADEKKTIPYVGQYRMKSVLDDCYIRTNFTQNGLNPPRNTIVDNLDGAMSGAKCIYTFFLKLLNLSDDKFSTWEGTYVPVIKNMLSFRDTDITSLSKKWKDKCPDITFSYDKNEIITKLKNKADCEYLFGAAVVADDMRKIVVTAEKAMDVEGKLDSVGSITFSSIKLDDKRFFVSATGTATATGTPKNLTMLLLNDRGQQVDSRIFAASPGSNSITGVLENNVPLKKNTYTLQGSFFSMENGKQGVANGSKDIVFEDTSTLLKCTKNNLKHIDEKSISVLYNMIPPIGKGIFYPDNSDYFNQDNHCSIDILLPLEAEFTLSSDYTYDLVEAQLSLSDGKNTFIHCGNGKHNKVVFNEDKSVCSITFAEDWKNQFSIGMYFKKTVALNLSIHLDVKITAKDGSDFTGSRDFVWESDSSVFPKINFQWVTDAKKR